MKIGSLRDHAVRNWLYSASKNVLFEHYRERSMNYACEQIDEVSLLEDEKLTYIDDFDLNIIIDDILKSIGDPLDMLIFEYMALCGLTFSETSKLTRLTAPAVRYRYKIILNRVLASLSKYGINSIGDIK
jgi:hypothetical protein